MATKLRTAEKVGDESSGEQVLKANRRQVAEGLVDAASVVEQKKCCNRVFGFLPGLEMQSVDAFDLERLEERLGAGVVVRRAQATHALDVAYGGHLAPKGP